MADRPDSSRMLFNRRELGKIAIGGALGATILSSSRSSSAVLRPQPPGIKLGSVAPANPTEDDLLFFRQLGVDCVFCAVTPELNSVEGLLNQEALRECGTHSPQRPQSPCDQ